MIANSPIRVIKSLALLVAVSLISGCIATGIRVGPVFIPVDTGIGKTNKPPKTDDSKQQEQVTCEVIATDQNKDESKSDCEQGAEQQDEQQIDEDEQEIHF